ACALADGRFTLQDFYRLETRQVEGGITSRDYPRDEDECDSEYPEGRTAVIDEQFLVDEDVVVRQQEVRRKHGDNKGNDGDDHRFTDELEDQFETTGTDTLSDTYFTRPAFASGGGQVHEVDAR